MLLKNRLRLTLLSIFVILSILDFAFTMFLVQGSGGVIYESNPIANWFLQHLGWIGLAGFKLSLVAFVAWAALMVSRWRPRLSLGVLSLGCVVMMPVVGYSVQLTWSIATGSDDEGLHQIFAMESQKLEHQRNLEISQEYRDEVNTLTEQLKEGSIALPDAAARLSESRRAHDPRWLDRLHDSFPGCSDEACLAANLVTHVLVALREEPTASAVCQEQMTREFRDAYDCELPLESITHIGGLGQDEDDNE
jgi:uncharacterized membrane protein YhaH (DUF805 family)